MINKVYNFVSQNKILEYGDSVILGVSGGADSICMLHVLHELKDRFGLSLKVVHVNHHIRGDEAQRDADYVKHECDKLGILFVQIDADVPLIAKKEGLSEEEAGRNIRYKAFFKEASEFGANKIAVAHNLNDSSETVLFNLFRGTGIKGMAGIPLKRGMIIRPLLCCTREEIEHYLAYENINFCTDSTNTATEYSRNKIRLELMPYIKKNINKKAEHHIVNAAQSLEEISDFLDKEVKKAYDEYVDNNVFKEDGFITHSAVQKEIIRRMIERQAGKLKDITTVHILSVLALKEKTVSKTVNLPYEITARRTYEGILIEKNKNQQPKDIMEELLIQNGHIFQNEKVEISVEKSTFDAQNIEEIVYTKWLDYDKIEKLILRHRQEGDYIIVDDKGSRKKLKDYLINEKIPKEKRDDLLLIADGSHIVWIVGYRISSYYKISESTSKIVKLTYKGQRDFM